MRGINKVCLLGNLGADPEIKYLQNGTIVANLSLATNEDYKDKQGQEVKKTEWHRIVFFERLAEVLRDFAKKGSKLYIEGQLRTRKWTDDKGVDRWSTEIIGREMRLLDSKEKEAPEEYAQYSEQLPPSSTKEDDIPF